MKLVPFAARVYLAVGYTNGDHEEAAMRSDIAAAYLMEICGYAVFAPITQSHRIARYVRVGNLSHEFWLGHDSRWMDCCDKIIVLVDGNEKNSFGIAFEIGHFTARDNKVEYLYWKEVEEWHLKRTLNSDGKGGSK
jgi:nucleoside 2-deoxyribosyltransferase